MAKMQALVSMERDDDDKVDAIREVPLASPDYPYGLRICLTHDELQKLGLEPPGSDMIGGCVYGHFAARVTSVSASDDGSPGGCCARVELQIENLAIDTESDGEDEEY